jgi:hypothetical protein
LGCHHHLGARPLRQAAAGGHWGQLGTELLGASSGSAGDRTAAHRQASSPIAAAPEPAQVPLPADTIQQLPSTLRSLPRPLLDSLTQGFRRRFQVLDSAVTIADRITLQCHDDRIETFLVSHREVRSADPHREVRSADPHREVRSADPHREVRSAAPHESS